MSNQFQSATERPQQPETAAVPESLLGTIAIVVSNYNYGRYLPDCLAAIAGQTVPADEVIITDDCSTDESVSIIQEWLPRLGNVRFIRNSENCGAIVSSNNAFSLTTSQYVYFGASDDFLFPRFIERFKAAIKSHPGCGLYWARTVVSSEDDLNSRINGNKATLPLVLQPGEVAYQRRKRKLLFDSPSTVFQRSALIDVGTLRSDLRFHCDYFSILTISHRYPVCVLPEVLVYLRLHPASYHQRGQQQPVEKLRIVGRFVDLLESPEFSDVAAPIKAAGHPMRFYAWQLFLVLWERRRFRSWETYRAFLAATRAVGRRTVRRLKSSAHRR